jgi:hypothetical protein
MSKHSDRIDVATAAGLERDDLIDLATADALRDYDNFATLIAAVDREVTDVDEGEITDALIRLAEADARAITRKRREIKEALQEIGNIESHRDLINTVLPQFEEWLESLARWANTKSGNLSAPRSDGA